MAISDDLNSIRTHLEDDYTALETLGVSVEDRNIENIKDMANQIYAKFPKTSYAEGSNITLSNTLKGKLDFEDDIVGYGDTKQAIIPSEYQQVEYIESSGTEFINTGIIGNNQLKIEATLKTKTVGVSQAVFGFFSSEGNKSLFLYCSSGKQFQVGYGVWGNIDILWQDNELYNISLSNGKIIINGTEKTIETASSFTTDYSMTIFKISGSSGSGMPIQLYKFKIYDNNTLVRDFIPCYRISDNVIGMYDIVNNTFYTNAGTGTFTKGANAPTPSTPIDIEVVRGKNRLDDSNLVLFNSNKYISTTNYTTQGKIAVNPSTTYTLIYKASTISDIGMWEFDSSNNKTAITYTAKANGNYHIRLFTTLSNTKTMSFYAGSSDTYTSVEEFLQAKELVILEGDYSSQIIPSYLPYNTIEVVERGKNLCNSTEYRNASINSTVGDTITFYNSTATKTIIKCAYLYAGTTYTFSKTPNTPESSAGRIIDIVDDNDKILEYISWLANSTSLTYTPTNSGWLYLAVDINATNIMLETGSTATTYEPYITPQTYQLSLGEYEFAKIGNYVDTIEYDVDEDKVYKNEKIRDKTFTGASDENWSMAYVGTNSYTIGIDDIKVSTEGVSNPIYCMSNIFKGVSFDNRTTSGDNIVYGDQQARITVRNISYTSIANFKTMLSSTNMKLIYVKGTPTQTEITGTLKDQIKALYYSHSFTGTTIIEIDGQLPLIIKVRALKGE